MSKKVVLITGISSGFGHAIAKKLAEEGHIVYGTIRKNIYPIDGVNFLTMDVNEKYSVKLAVEELIKREGKIDVLINNAGIGYAGAIEDFSEEEIQLQMKTNFMGYVYTIQEVLPYMRKRKKGKIIQITSLGGIMGLPYQGFYSASKFAIEGLSEALAMELKPYGIKVIVIRPGDFHTHFTKNRKILKIYSDNNPGSYYNQLLSTLKVIENDEMHGLSPEYLAKKMAKIVKKRSPKFSYIIAKPEQKFAAFLKKVLPQNLFFSILASHYKIN